VAVSPSRTVSDDKATGRDASAEGGFDFLSDEAPAKQSRGPRSAADTPVGDDDFTDFDLEPAMSRRPPARSSIGSLATRSKKKKKGLPSWAIPAIVAASVAIIGGIGYAVYLNSNPGPKNHVVAAEKTKGDPTKPKVEENKTPVLTIDWPENQRAGASLFVDGKKTDIPTTGAIQIPLPPSNRQYEFRLERKGFEPKEFRRASSEDDQAYVVKEWDSTVQGNDLEQDFEVAKKSAGEHNKNVMIIFDASDAKESKFASQRFGEAVLLRHEFTDKAKQEYVCVYIDNLQNGDPSHRVLDAARNQELTDKFKITVFPTVVVTDPKGRPFGVMDGYTLNGVNAFLELMTKWDADNKILTKLLAKVDALSSGTGEADSIGGMLDFLEMNDLDRFYRPAVEKLTARLPAGGRAVSKTTAALWLERFRLATKNPDQVKQLVAKFDDWKKNRTFKDKDLAAELHLAAAYVLAQLDLRKEAEQKCKEALACDPHSPELRSLAEQIKEAISGEPGKPVEMPAGSGSGYCIAQGNYVLTNHHVIHDAKKIRVHLNGNMTRYPAKLIADNETGDMALLKIDLPADKSLVPIPLAPSGLNIGEDVCAMGFPGVMAQNITLTLTKGIISTIPGADDTDGFVGTDCKVNPGNSGGPLCNFQGCVAGMVTAKSHTTEKEDSYGLAIPVDRLRVFLMQHLPPDVRKQLPPPKTANYRLADLAKIVAPSVVYIENLQTMQR
jgi:S1-C subfamily serine protease